MSTTSLTLLNRLTNGGDDAAWSRFVDLYTPLMLGWCHRLGLADVDAADLVQTVFVTCYEKIPGFHYDAQRSFRAWLKTVLMNAWRNQCRRRGAGPTLAPGAVDPDSIPDTDPRLELDEAEYRSALIQRAMLLMRDSFETSTWKACYEFVVQDRPAAEVAAELGLSVNAVYLAKSRVLRHLRQELSCFLD